jgi:uncharacterized membrane protein SpoIIM required for sporulation
MIRERIFVERRRGGWDRLEALIERCDRKGLSSLDPSELQELALLYRSGTTDLAAAKSRGYSSDLIAYLNRSTARGYAIVHAGTARGGWSNVATFFTTSFPREVRRSRNIIMATTTLFLIAIAISYWMVAQRSSNVYALLPAEMIPTMTKSLHDSNFGFDRNYAPEMSSEIITNNIKVTMVTFAGGITTLGILTIWEITFNGLMLGALAALFTQKGFGLDFWATIAPHGVIELSAIQIAGAAGLQFAQAIIAPGRLRRIDALRIAGRRAGVLMIGVAGLLVIAGTIEGFVSPQRTSETFRLAFGGTTAVVLFGYLALAGREKAPRTMRLGTAAPGDRARAFEEIRT